MQDFLHAQKCVFLKDQVFQESLSLSNSLFRFLALKMPGCELNVPSVSTLIFRWFNDPESIFFYMFSDSVTFK